MTPTPEELDNERPTPNAAASEVKLTGHERLADENAAAAGDGRPQGQAGSIPARSATTTPEELDRLAEKLLQELRRPITLETHKTYNTGQLDKQAIAAIRSAIDQALALSREEIIEECVTRMLHEGSDSVLRTIAEVVEILRALKG